MLSEVVDQIIERGKEEGLEQKARETARRMLARGYATDEVAEVTGLEIREIRLLADSLDSGRE